VSRRFPVCSAKDVIKVLRQYDFVLVGQAGCHQKWRHANGRQVIVAVHGSKPIPIGTLKSMIEGSGPTWRNFADVIRQRVPPFPTPSRSANPMWNPVPAIQAPLDIPGNSATLLWLVRA
jgi:predicted RNA binding protein YcfA (HicA-like mRNA interferase family)